MDVRAGLELEGETPRELPEPITRGGFDEEKLEEEGVRGRLEGVIRAGLEGIRDESDEEREEALGDGVSDGEDEDPVEDARNEAGVGKLVARGREERLN